MKALRKCLLAIAISSLSLVAFGQQVKEGTVYRFSDLAQEPISNVRSPYPDRPEEKGDTTFTIYTGTSADLRTYFVHGEQYHNVFNPNPTGVYINGQEFKFYCSYEKSFEQKPSNFLFVQEFTYLSKTFLVMVNFREDCMDSGCAYRCYNVFDISDPKRVDQYSFSTTYEGLECFGDFNSDGLIDYVRAAPTQVEEAAEEGEFRFNVTAYTFSSGDAKQLLNNDKQAYYLTVVSGSDVLGDFEILKADWFFPVRGMDGEVAEKTPYFPPYISFDPAYQHLFNSEGVRIEKQRYSVRIKSFGDVDAATAFCERMQYEEDYREVFVMVDQYGDGLSFMVLIGNFQSKDLAESHRDRLANLGYKGELVDFENVY